MTDGIQELDVILEDFYDGDIRQSDMGKAKQALLDWHNKQIEEIIKKPHILPKNAQHQESVKQGINFYHRQMRKRVDELIKEGENL